MQKIVDNNQLSNRIGEERLADTFLMLITDHLRNIKNGTIVTFGNSKKRWIVEDAHFKVNKKIPSKSRIRAVLVPLWNNSTLESTVILSIKIGILQLGPIRNGHTRISYGKQRSFVLYVLPESDTLAMTA